MRSWQLSGSFVVPRLDTLCSRTARLKMQDRKMRDQNAPKEL